MIAASFGYIPPIAGALLQEAIDVAVILNALRATFEGQPLSSSPGVKAGAVAGELAEGSASSVSA